jgi:hypothetical protein
MGIPAGLEKFRPGYRVTSVFAGAVVFAGAAFFVAGGANADTEKLPKAFNGHKRAGDVARSKIVSPERKNKLPNVTKVTTDAPKLGKSGPAFESPAKAEPRIVGGTNASAANHPYIIGLLTRFYVDEGGEYLTQYQSTCTGTVIAPNKVLTAGHCSFGTPIGTTYVIAGRDHLETSTAGFVTTARASFIHQGYAEINDAYPNNDVSVLTLTHDLPAEYTPIALGAQGDESVYADGTQAQIVGYGVSGPGAGDHKRLRSATLPIRSDSACSGIGPYQNGTMACAGAGAGTNVDTCGGDSGGPLIVTQNGVKTEVGITSWGPPACNGIGAYAQISTFSNLIKADIARKPASNLDWTGDGQSDLFARDSGGNIYLYSGSGLVNSAKPAAFDGSSWEGEGWAGFRKLFRTYNWNGDRTPSIFGVLPNGNLYQYRGNGQGNFTTAQSELIGSGWSFTDILVTNNWTGNGRPNLLGRAANGDLYLYTSNGAGGWENAGVGIKIGNGWNAFNTILTPGDWLNDGRQSLIGRTPAGDLRLYQSNGNGGWVNGAGVQIGNGWNIFSIFMSPGDMNGDNLVDMIGVTPAGQMRLYMTDGKGNWLNGLGQEIGTGWNGFTAVF